MFIYKITNQVNGKVYIGQSNTDPESGLRWIWHINASNTKSKYPTHKAIRKYTKERFLFEIIDYAKNQEELNDKEIYWIAHYNTFLGEGYNCAPPGGNIWANQSEEFKNYHSQKVREGFDNMDPETRERLSNRKSEIWAEMDPDEKTACFEKRIKGNKDFWAGMIEEEKYNHLMKSGVGSRRKYYLMTNSGGNEYFVYRLRQFYREHNIGYHAVYAMITQNRYEHVIGWTGQKITKKEYENGATV